MNCLRHVKHFKSLIRLRSTVASSCQQSNELISHKFNLSKPTFDEDYLLNVQNIDKIADNIKLRKGVGDIQLVHELKNKLDNEDLSDESRIAVSQHLQDELKKIPNDTHPDVRGISDEPKVVAYYNEKPEFKHTPLEFSEITKKLNLLRTDHLGNYAGHKSYFLVGELAELVSDETVD